MKYLHIKQMMDEWSIANTSGLFSFAFHYFVDETDIIQILLSMTPVETLTNCCSEWHWSAFSHIIDQNTAQSTEEEVALREDCEGYKVIKLRATGLS